MRDLASDLVRSLDESFWCYCHGNWYSSKSQSPTRSSFCVAKLMTVQIDDPCMPTNINPGLCLGSKCFGCLPFCRIGYAAQPNAFKCCRFGTLSQYASYGVLVVPSLPSPNGSALVGTLFLTHIAWSIAKHQKSGGKLASNNSDLA